MGAGEELSNPSEQPETTHRQDEWDSLKEISFDPEQANQVILKDEPLKEGREDFGVTVRDASGNEKKTSSIMMGKNREGIELENGAYISINDVEKALMENLSTDTDASLVSVLEDYAPVSVTDAMKEITSSALENRSGIGLKRSDRVPYQDARRVEIIDTAGEKHQKGLLMLGNEQVEIPDGLYLKPDAVEKALGNYMVGTPVNATLLENIPPEKQPSQIRENLQKLGRAAIALLLIASMTLLGGSSIAKKSQNTPDAPTPKIEADQGHADPRLEAERALDGISIGDTVDLPSGIHYHESSDYDAGGATAEGVVGEELPPGNYSVESFSIVNPETHEFIAENVTWENGTKLSEYLGEISARTGIPVEDLKDGTRMHLSNDASVAGWSDYEDIISQSIAQNN